MQEIHRYPAVAGLFYPDSPDALRSEVSRYLEQAAPHGARTRPKALIAPHAGYIYSGQVAASAYALLRTMSGVVHRVVMLGPTHRMAIRGIACSSADYFETPLGSIPVDRAAVAMATRLPQVHLSEAPFEGEHCLEVQLPFLQLTLDDFAIVPLLVGDASSDDVAELIETLWGGDETLIVVSSDLSHYLDYNSACKIDAETTVAIKTLHPEYIAPHQACGQRPISGLLKAVQHHGLKGTVLDLRNSGDTAGPRNQVVGYGAYAFA